MTTANATSASTGVPGSDFAHSLDPNLQAALQIWLAVDWGAQVAVAEQVCQQAKELQKQAMQKRKTLSETTKVFKKSIKDAKLSGAIENTVKNTIKSYQEEIDVLTRRCKSSETAYAQLTQNMLLGLPAPGPLVNQVLQQAQIQIQQAQASSSGGTVGGSGGTASSKSSSGGGLSREEREELIELRREVAEYEVEFRNLKNQDITIRKLETKIFELENGAEDLLEERLKKHQEELEEREGRRVLEVLDREAALEAKVETLELQLRAERAGREATADQFLQADEGANQREAAWEAQREILVQDGLRLREQLQATHREREELKLQVAALQGSSSSSTKSPASANANLRDLMAERKAYEAEVAELSATATLLREELQLKDEQIQQDQDSHDQKVRALHDQVRKLEATVQSLDAQLASAPPQSLVESMRRELRILKRLEYNADNEEDEDTGGWGADPEIAGGEAETSNDLEAVLVSKLRRAEADLVSERIAKTNLVERVDVLKDAVTKAEQAKAEADNLVVRLENDLERAIHSATPASAARKVVSVPSIPTQDAGSAGATLQTILDPNAPTPPLAADKKVSSVTTTTSEKAEDDHSVATIVMAQRDRLRARCEALEAERDSFKRELQVQVQSSESLKADNTKLYEKVRYLQSYNKQGRRTTPADRDLDLEALEQRYEASVDPFRQFSRSERQRKLNEMSAMERAVYLVAKTVLATREMRTALFFYVSALHLLVFVTTYHWSHDSAECHNVNNDHLAFLPHEQQAALVAGQGAGAKTP